MSVLFLHHEDAAARTLAPVLERAGYVVTTARDARSLELDDFDVVTLGPEGSEEERAATCRNLRARGYLGAIVALTADSTEVQALLDAGADELVVAPFEPAEVEVRVRVALRRAVTRSRSRWGPFEIDRVHRTVHLRGNLLTLTAREYALLACLLDAAGQPVARTELLRKIWGRDHDSASNMVQVHLSRLRDKLGADAALVETMRGAGYRLRG